MIAAMMVDMAKSIVAAANHIVARAIRFIWFFFISFSLNVDENFND
jgi:hypothetical protein